MSISIRKPYGKRTRVGISEFSPSLTQQQFRDECNINNILEKYQKTGAIAHANNHAANYGFASSLDFRESMEIVTQAQEMFQDLPSSIRNKFGNSPEAFLDFAQNPENASEMVSLGLAEKKDTPTPKQEKTSTTDVKSPSVAKDDGSPES